METMEMATMKLTNLTGSDIRLPTGHVIPKNGSCDLPRSTVAHVDNQNFLAGLERSRKITTGAAKGRPVGTHPDPDAGPFSRKWLAEAQRAQLAELAEAHGVGPEVIKGKSVDDLREFVANIMFVDG